MRMTGIRQRGTGLIEVMISVTLGLVVLAALLKSYADSKATFRVQDSVARLQENARYAMYLISRDLRMAGYRACARDAGAATARNTLNTPSEFLYDFAAPVQGYDGNPDGSWTPSLPAAITAANAGTDVLVFRGALDDGAVVGQEMPSASSDLAYAGNLIPQPFETGDIVMVSDCLGSAIFQVTRHSTGNVAHDVGNSPQPGNRTRDLGRRYPMGAQLFRIATTSYFIRAGNNGRSLWRKTGNGQAQELVEGVQDMQVQFGLDTDGDRMPNRYINGAAIPDFRKIVSVRIALLFLSLEPVGTVRDTRTFALLDRTVGPFNDVHLYQVMTSTITLRNKAL